MTPHEMAAEVERLSGRIDDGIRVLRQQSEALAAAEMEYRQAKAHAWIMCPTDDAGTKAGDRDWTAAKREAWVNAETAELRYKRDLAEGTRQAALEAVRARRAQLSALMTLLAAHRSEAELARVDQR